MSFDDKIIARILNGVKVSDDHILLGLPIKILKYGKEFEIKQVNWFYKWEKFTLYFGSFLNYFMNTCENFRLPTSMDDIKAFRDSFRMVISNKIYGYRALNQLIKIMKLYSFNVKFMKKNFDIDDWAEFFIWVYIFNIFGVKKNLKIGLSLISRVQSS
jgi:hypothetical protein